MRIGPALCLCHCALQTLPVSPYLASVAPCWGSNGSSDSLGLPEWQHTLQRASSLTQQKPRRRKEIKKGIPRLTLQMAAQPQLEKVATMPGSTFSYHSISCRCKRQKGEPFKSLPAKDELWIEIKEAGKAKKKETFWSLLNLELLLGHLKGYEKATSSIALLPSTYSTRMCLDWWSTFRATKGVGIKSASISFFSPPPELWLGLNQGFTNSIQAIAFRAFSSKEQYFPSSRKTPAFSLKALDNVCSLM